MAKLTPQQVLQGIKAGKYPSQIARELHVSHTAVLKKLHALRLQGIVKQVNHYPAFYEVITPEVQAETNFANPSKANSLRVVEPHKFGEWFAVESGRLSGGRTWCPKPNLVCRRWLYDHFTIIGYSSQNKPEKLVVWLKAYKGFTPIQQVTQGRIMLRQFTQDFATKNGLVVNYLKTAGPREWATTTIGHGLSEELIDGLRLRENNRAVGDVEFTTDRSHPGRAEFKTLEAKNESTPDIYAQRLHEAIATNVTSRVNELERGQRVITDATLKGVELMMDRIRNLEGNHNETERKEIL